MLSDSDSESVGDNVLLTINEHYAKVYEYKKEREELAKCTCLAAGWFANCLLKRDLLQ